MSGCMPVADINNATIQNHSVMNIQMYNLKHFSWNIPDEKKNKKKNTMSTNKCPLKTESAKETRP